MDKKIKLIGAAGILLCGCIGSANGMQQDEDRWLNGLQPSVARVDSPMAVLSLQVQQAIESDNFDLAESILDCMSQGFFCNFLEENTIDFTGDFAKIRSKSPYALSMIGYGKLEEINRDLSEKIKGMFLKVSGRLERLARLFANAKDIFRRTLLHYAAQGEDMALIDLLLKNGAKIDVKAQIGSRPRRKSLLEFGRDRIVNYGIWDGKVGLRIVNGKFFDLSGQNGGPALVMYFQTTPLHPSNSLSHT